MLFPISGTAQWSSGPLLCLREIFPHTHSYIRVILYIRRHTQTRVWCTTEKVSPPGGPAGSINNSSPQGLCLSADTAAYHGRTDGSRPAVCRDIRSFYAQDYCTYFLDLQFRIGFRHLRSQIVVVWYDTREEWFCKLILNVFQAVLTVVLCLYVSRNIQTHRAKVWPPYIHCFSWLGKVAHHSLFTDQWFVQRDSEEVSRELTFSSLMITYSFVYFIKSLYTSISINSFCLIIKRTF